MNPPMPLSLLRPWLASLLLFLPQFAGAAVIPVTTTLDVVNGADGVTSLREAVNQAGANASADEIVLANGATYDLTDCVAGQLDHTSQDLLTLSGNGATIHQSCAGERIIENTTSGPAITDGSFLIVDGVTFTNTAGGGLIDGAAIRAKGSVTISDSTFSGIDAGGGSVLRGNTFTSFDLDNVDVTNNNGSALLSSVGGSTITNSDLSGNAGAGVNLTDGHPLVIIDSTISNNQGVGVRVTGSGEATADLTNVTIENNDDVGFLCSFCLSTSVVDSTIGANGQGPAANGGGGVHVTYGQNNVAAPVPPSTTITGSHIDGNLATRNGGGVSIEAGSDSAPMALTPILIVSDSSIDDNVAEGPGCCNGGGIFVGTGQVEITNTTIDGNRAGQAGAVPGGGGGIYFRELDQGPDVVPAPLLLTDSSVSDNEANNSGGGITVWDVDSADLLRVQVTGNQSHQAEGGGIFSIATDSTLIQTSLASNSSRLGGGGIRVGTAFGSPGPGSLHVVDSTVHGNASVMGLGGGILVGNIGGTSPTVIQNSTITENSSTQSGGGITMGPLGDLTLLHTTLVENSGPAAANLQVFLAAGGSLDVTASVMALPVGGASNCDLEGGAPTSGGFSFADDASCNLGVNDTVQAVDPQLAALADNGGPTLTRLPAPTSPIAGLVPAVSCGTGADQRGVLRPQGPACDAGAVEIAEAGGAAPIIGTNGDDTLVGTPGDDVIIALGGDDLIFGLGGNDIIIGGRGRDLVFGGPGNDELRGGKGSDLLFGGSGNDELRGGRGNDLLFGGSGFDRLVGGPGSDLCLPFGGTAVGC